MPLRFRKQIKLAPGMKLTIGKKSVGVSAGGKYGGVTCNSRNGLHGRASLYGTGLSYTTKNYKPSSTSPKPESSSYAASPEQLPDKSDKSEDKVFRILLFAVIAIGILAVTISRAAEHNKAQNDLPEPTDAPVLAAVAETEEPYILPPGIFAGDAKTLIYHASTCELAAAVPFENLEQFLNSADAEKSGYHPHADCLPDEAENYTPPEYVDVNNAGTANAAEGATYYASAESHKYHRPGCRSIDNILPANLAEFDSKNAAEALGYEPCNICNP